MKKLLPALLFCAFLFSFCNPPADKKTDQPQPVVEGVPVPVQITDLNCWTERGTFYVTGICNSQSDQWQKIRLRMTPFDSTGQALKINGGTEAEIPVFSAAIPPRGRSAFFQGWPMPVFSGKPDTCRIVEARGMVRDAGPVLLVQEQSGVKMALPGGAEQGWQVGGVLSNPLTFEAAHPHLEMLLYGTDRRLWLAVALNIQDPGLKNSLHVEGTGPMAPGSKRPFGMQVTYGNLPEQLNNLKIGRVDMLAFDNR
ncbi:MAG TPA: hypothetical protein PLM41_19600 [Saprospiraceae bacterium]|nr:hypothetical protein [Saprospiraceae bacterium]